MSYVISFIGLGEFFYNSFYFVVNIKNISTITVREKLPRSRKSDVSNSYSTVSSMSKPIKINNQQTGETDSKRLKVSNQRHKKRKRKESSGKSIIINYHKRLIDIDHYIGCIRLPVQFDFSENAR